MATTFEANVKGFDKVVAEYNKVQREVTKLRQQLAEMTSGTDAYGESHKRAGDKSKKHFDIMAAGRKELATMLTSYASIGAAVRVLGDAMAYVQAETNKAVESMKAMQEPGRRLAQIATSAEDLSVMNKQADELAAKYGEDRQKVRSVMFSARSEGFTEALPDIIKYGDVVDTEAAAGVAGQVPALFGGKIGAMEAISATLLGAEKSRLSFEGIARALPGAAEGGALAGASAEETIGTLSVLAGRFKSGETAADRMKILATKLGLDERFKGKGLIGGVEALQAMAPEEQKDFLGESQELNAAFKIFSEELPAIKQRSAEIGAEITSMRGGGVSTIERKYQQFYGDTTSVEGRQRIEMERLRQAGIMREIANEQQFGITGVGQQVAADTFLTELKKRRATGFEQFGAERGAQAAAAVGAGETGTMVGGMAGLGAARWVFDPTGVGSIVELLKIANQQRGVANDQRGNRPRSGASAEAAATAGGQMQR